MSDLKKLLRSLNNARSAKEKLPFLEDLAEYFLMKGENHQALDYYKAELDAAVAVNNEEKIAKAHRMIGEVNVELSEFDEALKHTMKYYDYARADDSRVIELQRALTTLGRTYFIKADSMSDKKCPQCKKAYAQAEKCLLQSLKFCEKLEKLRHIPISELNDMRARSMLNLGLTYEGMEKLTDAAHQFKLAILMCRKHNIENLLRSCLLSFASLLVRQGEFAEAFQLYQEAHATVKSLPEKDQKKMSADILVAESEGHLLKGDIHSARKALHQAYKLIKPCPSPNYIADRLKLVVAMDIAQRKVLSSSDMPPEEKSKTYETIGDGFTSVGVLKFARDNYEKMLENAKIADKNLKACYVSLAQTCMELKDYDEAVRYFDLEMQYCDSPLDQCDSLLNIFECQVFSNKSLSEQLETLNRAYGIVKETNSAPHKKKALVELEKVQRAVGNEDVAESIKAKIEDLGYNSDEEEDELTDNHTPNIGEYIDLDALSDYSGHEEVEEGVCLESIFSMPEMPRAKRNPSRFKTASTWRNEKGETKLHRACIDGKLNAVRTLLEQGCEVHAVDHAGWTPLHEACNLGHIEIIEKLLEHGADINHRGGPGAGGITPLSDAGQAGNFEVMEYLLDKKASPLVLTDNMESPLDSIMAYYERSRGDMSQEEKNQYFHVKDRLERCLEKAGVSIKGPKMCQDRVNQSDKSPKDLHSVSKKKPSPNIRLGKLRRLVDDDGLETSLHRKRSMREISPVSSPESFISSDEEHVDEEGRDGVSEYISAMQNLRKSLDSPMSSDQIKKKPVKPLVDENEIVEDWLDDDLGKQPSRKRKKSDQSKTAFSNSYKPLHLKKGSTSRLSLNSCSSSRPSSVCSNELREDARLSSGSRNSDVMETSAQFSNFDMQEEINEDYQDFENSWSMNNFDQPATDPWSDSYSHSTGVSHARQTSLLAFGVTRKGPQNSLLSQTPTQVPSQQFVQAASCSVNVKVEDHLLAIYVENPSLSIGWLADEAAKRYKRLEGWLPILSLYSQDGAVYSEDDPVKMVLGGDVIGKVKSVINTSVTERYEEACRFLSTEINDHVLSLLEASQATHSLDIVDTMYRTQVFKPIFRAVTLERNLLKLNFSNNLLDDKGVMDLCENLGKLCSLRELDLSGNNISVQGVKELAEAAKKGSLKALVSLNLSHNNLGDTSLQYLVEITAGIPQMQNLSLADCMFTKSIWDKSEQYLTLNKVQTLDLSFNELHAKGLAGFLGFSDHREERRLNPERLRNLYLVGLKGERLCQEILLFLEQGNSIALRELHISHPAMQDDELSQLLGILRSALEFHTLRLPSVPNISAQTICQLLLRQPSLRNLEIHNSKSLWKYSDDSNIVLALSYAASSALESLTLRDVPEAAKEAWCAVKGPSSVKHCAFNLQLFSGQSVS